jgi:hypothetical protein
MVNKVITCRNATSYRGMLTRGKEYKVLDADYSKNCTKIVCDNGKTRLFPFDCFDLEGRYVPMLVSWSFDDNIEEVKRDDFLTWVEVTINLSDGTKRWCKLFTPELLLRILSLPNTSGIYHPNIIVVRSLNFSDVDRMLKEMDENDELIEASIQIIESTVDI